LNPVYSIIGMHRSNYSKIENGQRKSSLVVVDKITGYFNISIDELIHMGDDIPKEIRLEDRTAVEQVKLIPSAAIGLPTARQEPDPDSRRLYI
jgi:transcriptional regulator with XRE-family HTH domain